MSEKTVRIAIVGGRRGSAFHATLKALAERLELAAFCDQNEDVIASWKSRYPDIATYTRYEDLLDNPDIDAVYLATPFELHASQAIAALQAGKHVLSEVIASTTIEESWALVEAVEKTGLTYMLAENFIFTRASMMVKNMVHSNVFGEISFAEGAYLHDVKNLMHYPDGSLTWRGRLRSQVNAMAYPTHSLGPVSHWLKINKQDGDEYESMVSFASKEVANHHYFRDLFGDQHPGADRNFWKQGDTVVTLIKTKKGVLVQLRYDVKSNRPHQMMNYGIQGANGAYLSGRYEGEDPLVWIKGRSQGSSHHRANEPKAVWEPLWNYSDEYEHPLWREWKSIAEKTGHSGGDFFVMNEFCSAIAEKRPPITDVYDAVTWSSVFPLSLKSIEANGQPVPFVRFRRNESLIR
jgi:predicted dehydrogenase